VSEREGKFEWEWARKLPTVLTDGTCHDVRVVHGRKNYG
jgi:hypothetical protein